MELWEWLILASMFGVGGVFGFVYGRSKADDYTKARQLEQSLKDTQQQFDDYRKEVSTHFSTTADLFNRLTADYKAVFEHLASGSQALCSDQTVKLTADVPTAKLTEGATAADEPPQAQATAQPEKTAAKDASPATATKKEPAKEEAPPISTIEKAVESHANNVAETSAADPIGGKKEASAPAPGDSKKKEEAHTLH